MSKARDIADLDFNSPDIDGGNIDGATIGGTTPAAGTFLAISTRGGATFNENGQDVDFRVESNNNPDMFVVNGAQDRVVINSGGHSENTALSVPQGAIDLNGNRFIKAPAWGSWNNNTPYYIFTFNPAYNGQSAQVVLTVAAGGIDEYVIYTVVAKNAGGNTYITGYVTGSSTGIFNLIGYRDNTDSTLVHMYIKPVGSNISYTPRVSISGTGSFFTDSSAPTSPVDEDYTYNSATVTIQSASITNGAVINEASGDHDFRVESNDIDHMLFVDGGANHVNIGTSVDYGGKLNVNDSIYVGETNTPRIRLRNIGNSDTELGVNGLGAGLDTFYIAQYSGIAANEWDFRLTGASREFAFIRGGVVNEGAGDSDFRVESTGNSSMLHVDAANNRVGIGTSAPANAIEIRTNDGNTGHTSGLTVTNFSQTADARAGVAFRNYDNYGAAIYSPRTGSTQGQLVFATNTGYNTTEASVAPKLKILYNGGTEQYAAVNDARWFSAGANFNNPDIDLFTGSTTGANYPQTCFEVTLYGNGVSANEHQVFKGGGTFDYSSSSNGTAQNLTTYTNYHVGNALPANATFSLSGNTVRMRCNRQTNYDTFRVEVRVWGRSTNHAWGSHS
jgi:hypothetical protein